MEKLSLLFTRDSLCWHVLKGSKIIDQQSFVAPENTSEGILGKLDQILSETKFQEVQVISAINRFSMLPMGFQHHEAAYDLISYNTFVDREKEKIMLTVNEKFSVQFYYSFPLEFYKRINEEDVGTVFNFSGEKFLQKLLKRNAEWQVHLNLYRNQVEFFVLKKREVVLYNNLNSSSEVDFLYFIIFSISKMGFPMKHTKFFVYGDHTENETFISELTKFAQNVKVSSKLKQYFILK